MSAEPRDPTTNNVFGDADEGSGSEDADAREKVTAPIIINDTYKPTPESTGLSAKERFERDLDALPEAFNPTTMNLDLDSWSDAITRGMQRRDGTFWREGQPLQAGGQVEALVPLPRQRGAGLGSEASLPFDKKATKRGADDQGRSSNTYMRVSDKLVRRNTALEPGCSAAVVRGPHEGLHCKVVAFPDPSTYPRKDDPVTVSLLPGGSEAKIPLGCLKRASDEDVAKALRPRKDAGDEAPAKRPRRATPLTWIVKPGMLVRVIDRALQGGKLYNEKLRVFDIPSPCEFSLKTPTGVMEGLCEEQVESVIPRNPDDPLLVLVGSKRGSKAFLVSRNKKAQEVTVRFEGSLTKTRVYGFEEVCAV